MAETRADRICWTNVWFVPAAHVLAVAGVLHLTLVSQSWWTFGITVLWLLLCTLSISAGYHRLFSHRSYKARGPLRAFYLLFGAASAQNSALRWAEDHRDHHAWTDTERDPYDARRGFWWSHVGWVFFSTPEPRPESERAKDLAADPLVALQDRYYVPLAVFMGALLPAAIGLLWGDPLGVLLCVGFLRLVVQWHMTFCINSLAHMVGGQPYCKKTTARDSWIAAIFTFGEGYHNFHHRFQADYRNGHRWFHFDPSKWFVSLSARLGLAYRLVRMPRETIERARRMAAMAVPSLPPRREQAGSRAV